jgi:P-type conjugative transfer protein TrbJ
MNLVHPGLVLKARRLCLGRLLVVAALAFASPAAWPVLPVFDQANYSHSIMTDIQTLRSNINEATQLANQVTQIANEYRNLASMPFSVLQSYIAQYGQLVAVVQNISGLVRDVQNLQSRFETLFPDVSQRPSFTGQDMVNGLNAWRVHLNGSVLDSMKTGAQVLSTLPTNRQEFATLISQSQGAVGALQALQTGNQLSAQVAGQLLQLNAQMAVYQNAHLEYLASLHNEEAMSQRQKADNRADWLTTSPRTPAPMPGQ